MLPAQQKDWFQESVENLLGSKCHKTLEAAKGMSERARIAHVVNAGFEQADDNFNTIQILVQKLLEQMQEWNGKEIKDDPALTSIFQGTSSGVARARLRVWMEDFTPLRVRFERDANGKNTGKVLGIKLNTKNPDWKLPEAKANFFMDYSKETANKAKATPSIDKALDALFRQAARAIDGDGLSVEDARAQILQAVQDGFAARLLKAMGSESHQKWVETYQAQKQEAERVAKEA